MTTNALLIQKITAEDIRAAKPIVLQRLTGFSSSSFINWSKGQEMNTRTVKLIAAKLGVTPGEVMEGIRLRKVDHKAMKEAEAKFTHLLAAA